jgi:PAS domain S-box-containing protein
MVWDRTNRPVWLRCIVGVLVAVAAAAVRLQFLGFLGTRAPFLTFFPVVAFAALYGGFSAGFLATVLSAALANYFWMEPVGRFTIANYSDLISMFVFLSCGVLISYLAEVTYRAQARAEEQSRISAEREKAAAELRQSESKYRELVQDANSAIIRWKRDGSIVFFNEYAEQFFGYGAEEVIGKKVSILFPERESTGRDLTGLVQDIVDNPERHLNNINENVLRDGRRVWMAWTNRPIFDRNGQLIEILAVGTDITELRLAEEEIGRQREWLRVTLTSIGDAVIATDASGLITFINPVAEALTGWRSDQAIGLPVGKVFRIINEKTREPAADVIARDPEEGQVLALSDNAVLVSKDGNEIPVEDGVAPIRDDSGNVTGAVLVFHDVTGRRRAQETLLESEIRLRLAVDSADMGTWDYDPMTGVLNCSERCRTILGLPADTKVDRKMVLDRLHPDDRRRSEELFKNALDPTGGGRYGTEFRAVWPDGTERWIIASGKALFNEVDGEPSAHRFVGTVRDVTQRKQAEQKIRSQNAILETINLIFSKALTCETEEQLGAACLKAAEGLTQSGYGFIGELGRDGAFYYIAISERGWEVCTMYDRNIPHEQLPNLEIRGLHGRVLLDGKSLLTNDPASHPCNMGPPPGRPPLTAFLGVPLFHNEKIFGIVGLANREGGYTQEQLLAVEAIAPAMVEALMRKRAEYTLSQSQSRFKLLSETSSRLLASENPQAIVDALCRQVMKHLDCHVFFNFLVDETGRRLHLNAYAGIPEETAREMEWLDYGVAVCGCVARDGQRIVAEDIFNHPDIRTELVKSYGIQTYACHPLEIRGKVIGTLSFGSKTRTHFSAGDLALMKTVTDQVATSMEKIRLVEELRKSRDDLELRVQERTAELDGYMAKLRQSNQALQEFAYIAAHDMNEPLRKVISFGKMLESKFGSQLGQAGNDYLNRMINATLRMQALLNSLLEYSRVTTKPEPFRNIDLNDIVREVLSDLEITIAKTGGEVHVENLPVISADPTQIRQLFQNLIGNALKFQEPGEKPIVRVRHIPVAGSECRITVEDNGIGFDERHVEKIFAPFQRLRGRSEYEGTGMGLAICKKIVERHGGSIVAGSAAGKGSTFTITLPQGPPPE